MRDIRHDIRERLALVNGGESDEMGLYGERLAALQSEHNNRISAFHRERAALEQMLAIEEARANTSVIDIEKQKTAQLVPMTDFLVSTIKTRGPMEKDELRAEAETAGYFQEGNGRTFHTTLMNITNGNRIIRLADGRYAIPSHDAGSLFGTEGGDMQTLM